MNSEAVVQALDYWKVGTSDKAGFLDRVIALLAESGVRYCVIGGQGVNAFVEPVVSLDLDLAVAADDLASAEDALRKAFRVERFPHSVNVSMTGSDLRVQLRTDARNAAFVDASAPRDAAQASDRRTSPTSRDCSRPSRACAAGSRTTSCRA